MKSNQRLNPAQWAATALPGSHVTYYTGCLPDGRRNKAVSHVADEMRRLSDSGLVRLTQKRAGPPESNRFDYVATRTSQPATTAAEQRQLREVIASGRSIVQQMLDVS